MYLARLFRHNPLLRFVDALWLINEMGVAMKSAGIIRQPGSSRPPRAPRSYLLRIPFLLHRLSACVHTNLATWAPCFAPTSSVLRKWMPE